MFNNCMFGSGKWLTWIFWIIIISGINYLIYRIFDQKGSVIHEEDDTSLNILKRSYVKGEIEKEEFLRFRNDL